MADNCCGTPIIEQTKNVVNNYCKITVVEQHKNPLSIGAESWQESV